jgi:hypothetical protein
MQLSPYILTCVALFAFLFGIAVFAIVFNFIDSTPKWLFIFPFVGWLAAIVIGWNSRCPKCGNPVGKHGWFYSFPTRRC